MVTSPPLRLYSMAKSVHRLGLQAALAEIGVVQADHGRPVPGLVEGILAVGQFGTGAEIGELPGDQPFSVRCGSFSR